MLKGKVERVSGKVQFVATWRYTFSLYVQSVSAFHWSACCFLLPHGLAVTSLYWKSSGITHSRSDNCSSCVVAERAHGWPVSVAFLGQVQEFCPHGTKQECSRSSSTGTACNKLHFNKIIQKHTDESLGDCSFLNTCFHMDSCKYVHYEVNILHSSVVTIHAPFVQWFSTEIEMLQAPFEPQIFIYCAHGHGSCHSDLKREVQGEEVSGWLFFLRYLLSRRQMRAHSATWPCCFSWVLACRIMESCSLLCSANFCCPKEQHYRHPSSFE